MTSITGRTCRVLPPEDAPAPAKPLRKPKATAATRNRFADLNDFVDVTLAGLDPGKAVVWLVLFRDARNGIARTSQSDIARRAGLSVRQVRRAVLGLQEDGILKLVKRGNSFLSCSTYEVLPRSSTADTHVRSTADI